MSKYIPKHNLVEILRWLPVKSLLRCRCVSKSWRELIDSQAFIQDHLAVQKPRLIVQYDDNELLILDPRALPLFETINNERDYFIGTLHGVVCLFDYKSNLHLWNPSTRKLLSLPEPDRDFVFFDRDHDAYQDHTYSAFWINPSNKEFKIILFNMDVHGYDLFYSSIRNEWRSPSLDMIENCSSLKAYRSVVIGDVAYWGALDGFTDEEHKICNVVVIGFDFGKERFDLIKAPCVREHHWFQPILYKWKNGLSLACPAPEMRCDVYLRQQDSWVNMFRFDLASNVSRILWIMGEMEEMQEKSRILATTIHSDEVGELILCDARGGGIPLKGGLDYDFDKLIFVTCDFIESLLFP